MDIHNVDHQYRFRPRKNMFKLSYLFLLILTVSCSKAFYQLQEFERMDVDDGIDSETIDYTGVHLNLFYDFWEQHQSFLCRIENKSDSLMIIDLSLSHFIKNGIAYPYYTKKTTLNSISLTDKKFPTNTTTFNSAKIEEDDKLMVIPPHSSKYLQTYNFIDTFEHCDLKLYEDSSSISFTSQNSPLYFSNRLYYTLESNTRLLTVCNEFYLSKVENLTHSKLWTSKPQYYKCSNNPTGYYIDISPRQAKNRFYFRLR